MALEITSTILLIELIKMTKHLRNFIIELQCKLDENKFIPISPEEKKKLVGSFKNRKSQDPFNVVAEHLKYAGDNTLLLLTNIINYMMSE